MILAGGGFIVAGIGWYTYTTAQFAYANQWIGRMKATADSAFEQVQDPSDVMGFLAANRKQMSTYDQIARDQASSSHRASTWAMVVGLLLVVSGIAAAIFGSDAASKYAAAIVTATCAATSGYIASTFIKVQSSTQDQMRYFFQEPLVQSYLLSAERLIGQMPGRTEEHIDQYHAVITAALAQAANVNQQIRTPGLRRAQQPRRRLRKASPGALPSRDAVEDDTQV
ncbi:hypothetical protein ACFYO7_07540 [Nocardia salmonicida]|uniref:TRADD-N-associated membrane domain-containing protein n=1 Tax=Nocardia salmonicida TaxID=53431 RepID=UPI00367B2EE6